MAWYDDLLDWGTSKEGLSTIAGVGSSLYGGSVANDAAKEAAQANLAAANKAAELAEFKPYSVTTGLGTSYFDPESATAGYALDPALQAWRDQYLTSAAQAMPSSFDTAANAQQYYGQMQSMMQPARQAENLQMQQDLFGSGRLGMRLAGEGAGAGAGMVQPDVFGLNQARAQADQSLAQQARQQAMTELDQSIARGTGLMQTGLGVEQLGLTPLELGAQFGGAAASAGANQASNLLAGGQAAATANLAAGVGQMNMFKDLGLGMLNLNK